MAKTIEQKQQEADMAATKKRGQLEEEGTYVSPTATIEPPLMEADRSQMNVLEEAARIFEEDMTDESVALVADALRKPKGLHTKLAEIMEDVGRIPKNGTAPTAMGGYKFVQVGDAADVIRKALSSRKVSMLPESTKIEDIQTGGGKSGNMTTITVQTTWRLTDAETGETAVIQSLGTGADSGDKYSPKAQTNSMKYALLMGFLLSTGDDPEAFDLSEPPTGPGIVINESHIEGVRVGGRQGQATKAQIQAIQDKAGKLELSVEALVVLIAASLGGNAPDISATEDIHEQQRIVLDFLGGLSFADCGLVVKALFDVPA